MIFNNYYLKESDGKIATFNVQLDKKGKTCLRTGLILWPFAIHPDLANYSFEVLTHLPSGFVVTEKQYVPGTLEPKVRAMLADPELPINLLEQLSPFTDKSIVRKLTSYLDVLIQ